MHDLTLAQVRTLDRGRLLDEFPRAEVVNGVRYAARSHFGYHTSTARKLLMRLAVDPVTHEPEAEPEFVRAAAPSPTTSASTKTPASPTLRRIGKTPLTPWEPKAVHTQQDRN